MADVLGEDQMMMVAIYLATLGVAIRAVILKGLHTLALGVPCESGHAVWAASGFTVVLGGASCGGLLVPVPVAVLVLVLVGAAPIAWALEVPWLTAVALAAGTVVGEGVLWLGIGGVAGGLMFLTGG